MVRAMGLEPTRSYEHRHLKPACLPIPARSRAEYPSIIAKSAALSIAPRGFSPRKRGKGKGGPPPGGPPFSLSINPLYGVRGSFTQGELEGAKPASNQIKCRAKPCLARRAWSTPRVLALRREATIFVPQGGTKITTLSQAVERAKGFFDSLR